MPAWRTKPYRIPAYAQWQMGRRGITEEWVEKTIRSPDAVRPGQRPNRTKLEKRVTRNRRVIVVVQDDGPVLTVVTAWKVMR